MSIVGIEWRETASGLNTVSNDLGGVVKIGMYSMLPMQRSVAVLAITFEALQDVGRQRVLSVSGEADEGRIPLEVSGRP